MAKLNFSVVCDEIRFEKGRKCSLMGVFTKEILVPNFPFFFPRLALFQHWTEISRGQRFRISVKGEGIKGILVEGILENTDRDLEEIDANIAINFTGITISKPSKLVFETTLIGKDITRTHEVSIKRALPEQLV